MPSGATTTLTAKLILGGAGNNKAAAVGTRITMMVMGKRPPSSCICLGQLTTRRARSLARSAQKERIRRRRVGLAAHGMARNVTGVFTFFRVLSPLPHSPSRFEEPYNRRYHSIYGREIGQSSSIQPMEFEKSSKEKVNMEIFPSPTGAFEF